MLVFAATSDGAGSLMAALALAAAGAYWLLPKPSRRPRLLGSACLILAFIIAAAWLAKRFGPVSHNGIERALFALFATGAIVFSAVFLTQRNPARGAIAFAFVIVSVSGLLLLLAAPFLMAATLIVYAGAIVVTFLFVLMLSQTRLASNENDRSREPLLACLAGFSFLGLVLFAMLESRGGLVPVRLLSPEERTALLQTAAALNDLPAEEPALLARLNEHRDRLAAILEGPDSRAARLEVAADAASEQTRAALNALRQKARTAFTAAENRLLNNPVTEADITAARQDLQQLNEPLRLAAARGELPARNVANLGYLLYSEYLLAVLFTGVLLLVATLGAVNIAPRREAA